MINLKESITHLILTVASLPFAGVDFTPDIKNPAGESIRPRVKAEPNSVTYRTPPGLYSLHHNAKVHFSCEAFEGRLDFDVVDKSHELPGKGIIFIHDFRGQEIPNGLRIEFNSADEIHIKGVGTFIYNPPRQWPK